MKSINRAVSKLNIILLIANISVLLALYFFTGSNGQQQKSHDLSYQMETEEFLKRELDFSPQQYEKYMKMNRDVKESYQEINRVICENHNKLLRELSEPDPSLKTIDSLSRVIGDVHIGLKRYTARHFLNIKSICTPGQKEKLRGLIRDMLDIGSCSHCGEKNCQYDTTLTAKPKRKDFQEKQKN